MTQEQEFQKRLDEEETYENLMYEPRMSLEKDYEPDEIDEYMLAYRDNMKTGAEVMTYKFGPPVDVG